MSVTDITIELIVSCSGAVTTCISRDRSSWDEVVAACSGRVTRSYSLSPCPASSGTTVSCNQFCNTRTSGLVRFHKAWLNVFHNYLQVLGTRAYVFKRCRVFIGNRHQGVSMIQFHLSFSPLNHCGTTHDLSTVLFLSRF